MEETQKSSEQEKEDPNSVTKDSATNPPSEAEEDKTEADSKPKSSQVPKSEESEDSSKRKSRQGQVPEETDESTASKVKSRLQDIAEESEDAFDFDFDAPDSLQTSERVSEEAEDEEYLEIGPYGVHYDKLTQKHLKEIAYELGLIQLSWPPEPREYFELGKQYPSSYFNNDSKEKLLLLYTENFRRQFHFIYPDRRPLLLAADNEFGLQKMVCTTIRPTRLPYPELATWEGCANFIADHLQYEPLDKPTLFPERIISPPSVLEQQVGNCFEYSTLVCSYLIGIGYDAYVVSGYATYELCFAEQSAMENPELEKYKPSQPNISEPVKKKYEMKLTKDFDSKYVKNMKERAEVEARTKKEEEAHRVEEEIRALEDQIISNLPADDLFAVRVHSWILIRPGTLGVEEAFFIDPPTGRSYPPDDPNFLGLESLWSNTNYWVNLQDCSEGCKNLKFDLKDPTCWIWLLLAEPWYMREKIKEDEEGGEEDEEQDEDEEEKNAEQKERQKLAKYMVEKHLDMPTSWSSRPDISYQAYKNRFPDGQKEVIYKKSKVFEYAPYINKDGLVKRIVTYTDASQETQEIIYEGFDNRADQLTEVIKNFETESVTEKFGRGREEGLKEHQYFMGFGNIEDKRKMMFYSDARNDGLLEVEMDPLFMTLHYENRLDLLYYRHAIFLPRTRRESSDVIMEVKRSVKSLVEKYYRNPLKDNEKDIAERTYTPPDNKIFLKFHYGDNKVIASTREFVKPPPEKLGDKLTYVPDDTVGFNVDSTYPTLKSFELFELLKEQLEAEDQAFFDLRSTEDEINLLLKQRAVEVAVPKLTVSIYDTERNEQAKLDMLEKEKKIQEKMDKEYDTDIDYLAPYIARLGTNVLTHKDATMIRDQCLTDHKNLYVARANNLQHAFERTANTLRQKHQWFEENRDTITKEEEEDYFEQCNQLRFYLHTLEIRLKRHRDLVPQKYRALEKWLRNDPRLGILYF